MSILELASSIGWPVEFIAFERGIVVRPNGNAWVTHSASKVSPVASPDEVSRLWHPVLIRCRSLQGESFLDMVLHPEGGFAPSVPFFAGTFPNLYESLVLKYFSEAAVHHIVGIVLAYERVRDTFKNITLIPGAACDQTASFQDNPAPYFEFDALLGVVRRGYDVCRYPLWKWFGPGKGKIPDYFYRVLAACDRLDAGIRTDLQQSWNEWGLRMTAYRNCIHHYVPLDFGMSTIDMQETLPGVWAAQARIPDNPEARSKNNFTFAKGLDALTFGWTIAVELLRVLRVVSVAVEQQQKSGS